MSQVKSGVLTFDLPDGKPAGRIILYPPGASGSQNKISLLLANADEDFAKTFGIALRSGTFFHDNKQGIVLNETAVRMLGLEPANAIGKSIETPVGGSPVTITGVVKDFNFSSLQDKIGPIGFAHVRSQNTYRYLVLKLNTANLSRTIDEIKAKWRSFSPGAPFEYTFMDEKFSALYHAELQLQQAADMATVLNLVIVLLGIIGVVAFTITRRTREIALRKVLGADIRNIMWLFIKEYAVLICIANLIAWPIAYQFTKSWLRNYAYRIDQHFSSYALVSLVVFLTAFTLIFLQCFKTAIANPIQSLRNAD